MGVSDEPIWDGNGGKLDPQKATQRDLLVTLHVKTDQVIIPALRELQEFQRKQESGDLTKAQILAVKEVIQDGQDESSSRRALKTPVWALVISALSLVTSVVLAVVALTGGSF